VVWIAGHCSALHWVIYSGLHLQVCDANGQWYLADMGLRPGDLLVLTGRSLQHVTSGVCHAYAYRIDPYAASGPTSNGR
jgi:hypothetical protein